MYQNMYTEGNLFVKKNCQCVVDIYENPKRNWFERIAAHI